jgi:hypothetical protein
MSPAEQRFRQLATGSAKLILAEYLRERVQKKTEALVSCNENTFKQQQGRVLELRELISELERKESTNG